MFVGVIVGVDVIVGVIVFVGVMVGVAVTDAVGVGVGVGGVHEDVLPDIVAICIFAGYSVSFLHKADDVIPEVPSVFNVV